MNTALKAKKMTDIMPQTDAAFHFPQGIIGFTDAHRFGLIYEGVGNIACLQSLDHPEAAFLLTPWDNERLGPQPTLNQEQCQCIDIQDTTELLWLLVLNPYADNEWVTANLKAPIAVNTAQRLAIQCIRQEPDLPLRFHWMAQPQRN
ncbi:MAG: flagellar assembly protein FliW [Mariprofundus sp.]